jgi:hypothetical protein
MRIKGNRIAIEEDQNEDILVFTSRLIYSLEARFKAELELCKVMNPSTAILGIANVCEHVIL